MRRFSAQPGARRPPRLYNPGSRLRYSRDSAMRIRLMLAAVAALALAAGASAATLPRVEDDYARALAEARRRDVPILVDAWAPW